MRLASCLLAACAVSLGAAGCGGDNSNDTPVGPGLTGAMRASATLDTVGAVDVVTTTRPAVTVTGSGDAPRSGVQITFHVISGGGALTDSVVTTNAQGVATIGTWTLGPTPTTNVLEATGAGLTPVRFTVNGRWTRRLATTATGACAVVGGTTYCWGDNSHYEFGYQGISGSSTPLATPLAVAELYGNFGAHLCATTPARTSMCWGRGSFGQLGRGTTDGEANVAGLLIVTPAGSQWASLSPGRLSTCGVLTTGAGYCWGSNQQGEIGDSTVAVSVNTKISTPHLIPGGMTFRSITAGWLHACGITTAGDTYCWGENAQGQAGIGSNEAPLRSPRKVAGNQRFVSLTLGARFTCGLTADGSAYCWGTNATGQLGDGSHTDHNTPTAVAGGLKFTVLVAGSYLSIPAPSGPAVNPGFAAHVCGLTESGRAYCWGWNGYGQLGDASVTDRATPTPVAGTQTFSAISLNEGASCGMRGNKVWCWGGNAFGQVGDGTQVAKLSPTLVSLP